MNEPPSLIDRIASRATALYSRPTVAMEVVQLTDAPYVDPRAIKAWVEQDPALTSKILRVVNSSLYGLNTPVADLNQAVALLGIKPLKLLVLGFSLPEELFADMAVRELEWYWRNTLTRAVAARLIGEKLWGQPGDEAFIAGLLQDIGILVMIREFHQPYAKFLAGVIDEKCHLASLEQRTIQFDHIQLSAALLRRWRLPARVVDAVSALRETAQLAQWPSPEADLPQILHLADLLVQLLAQRRLQVLPGLLEAGESYRRLTKHELMELVRQLQPQVEQLAEVLSLELSGERDYVQTLLDAHERLGILAEELAGQEQRQAPDDSAYAALLAHSQDLSDAMQSFLRIDEQMQAEKSGMRWAGQHAAHERAKGSVVAASTGQVTQTSTLVRKLQEAANRCRERRQELSLLLIEPNMFDVHRDPRGDVASRQVRRAVGRACGTLGHENVGLLWLSGERTAVVLSDCDRRTAVAVAQHAITHLATFEGEADRETDPAVTLSAGVATAGVVPKNFEPRGIIDSAERCLSAARMCGISTVKSIEV